MDLTLSPQEKAFRDELRGWLVENHPGEEPEGDEAAFQFRREWQRLLATDGWAGLSWPEEYGGRGATLVEQAIFNEELAAARAPAVANVLGLVMGGPVVIAHGTEEQKERYLGPILTADEIWCQGFSEPESGSDLASLKTRAVKSDGGWVVTGQKVWTSRALYSDLMLRTLLTYNHVSGPAGIVAHATERGVPVIELSSKDELGHLMGKDTLGLLAVLNVQIAREIADSARWLAGLSEGG